jgi:ACS family glucarate transporter-like MFS transporter
MPKRHFLLLVTFSLGVLLYIDRICISVAEEPITRELALSDKQFGWIMSAFALGYALCQTPMGILADRMGPRLVLSAVVFAWSLFTGLTSAARNFASLFVVRLLFGAGEAGAFPGLARVVYCWMPMSERGIAQGINFSASRIGGALALSMVPWLIAQLGWRVSFVVLMLVGFVWAAFWYVRFRDDPVDHRGVSEREKQYIASARQQARGNQDAAEPLSTAILLKSRNMWFAVIQYFCSNFTFFFCLTWLFPYLRDTYALDSVAAGWYSAGPLLCGALGNVASGWLVDGIYRRGHWPLSRQLPAMVGFALAALGLVVSVYMTTPLAAVFWLSVAIFGADMTLSPSWSFCIDIGRSHAGAVSGTMNMAGNMGSFVTALAFPYLLAWTGTASLFFYVGAGLNLLAIFVWTRVKPDRYVGDY